MLTSATFAMTEIQRLATATNTIITRLRDSSETNNYKTAINQAMKQASIQTTFHLKDTCQPQIRTGFTSKRERKGGAQETYSDDQL